VQKLLHDLLAIRSTADNPSSLSETIRLVKEYLKNIDLEIADYERNGKPSVVFSTHPGTQFRLIMQGHLDVVPGGDQLFSPEIKEGRIHGRGASDMKGVDVAMIAAFAELVKANPYIDIALMLTTDEEIGGFDGVSYLVDEVGYKADVVFLPDSGLGNWDVCTDEKGVWWLEIKVNGKPGHASRPWQGLNAIDIATQLYREIADTFVKKWGICTQDNFWVPTVNLGIISGGQAYNQIPAEALMKLDFRYGDDVRLQGLRETVEPILKKYPVDYKVTIDAALNHTDGDNPYLVSWMDTVEKMSGRRPGTYKANGGSDGRFFAAAGMPVIMTKPLCSGTHGEDEWIDLEDLKKFQYCIAEWIRDTCS
jgi:succinyl-diaminopimelate desuccinylase